MAQLPVHLYITKLKTNKKVQSNLNFFYYKKSFKIGTCILKTDTLKLKLFTEGNDFMYKLISIDMDETLLNDQAQITTGNAEGLKAASRAGVKVVLNSGRGYASLQDDLETLDLKGKAGQYVISYNGAAIIENEKNKVIHVDGLEFDVAKRLFNLMRVNYPQNSIHIYTVDTLYVYHMTDVDRNYLEPRGVKWVDLENDNIDFLQDTPITKVIINILSEDERKAFEQVVKENIPEKMTVTHSSGRYLEYNSASASKGNAMLYLAEKLGIKPEETIAVGDNGNDLSMIKAAGVGVAVKNAHAQVLKVADYICQNDNNHDALQEVVQRFIES